MIQFIGEFQVKAELGRGGMGRVYRAYDSRLDHDVAIKILTNEGDPDLLARFRAEAGTTAKLRHPHIVTVHAFGEQEDLPYLVMELLEGEDLGRVIREKRPLTLLDKVRIMHQVAGGLFYAHQQNVVHRDIKPGNIMLLPDGSAKIMDFGIARVTGGDSTRRTQKGFLIGTISYMAPEQFKEGSDADSITDIFAFGDVLYELIAGVHPFHADDPGTQIFRITTLDPPNLHDLVPECPEGLVYIVQQLLSKDRDLRYQSLRDVVLDLEPVLFQLRHQHAEEMLRSAQAMIAEGQVEAGLDKVKQALEVDPVNREAQKLRNEIQRQMQAITIRSKVQSLLTDAERLLNEGKLTHAISVLEEAFRLDQNPTVRTKLDAVRAKQERIQRAALLLADAHREMHKGNLAVAETKLAEALECDPSNTDAGRLAARIREAVERAERERRIREVVQISGGRAANADFAGALKIIAEAEEQFGFAEDLETARTRIEGLKIDFEWKERQRRLYQMLVEIRTLVVAGRVVEARAEMDRLNRDYADWPNLGQSTQALRDDLARREREIEIEQIRSRVGALVAENRFSEARMEVDEGLRRFAGNAVLQKALADLLEAKVAFDRKASIARISESLNELRRRNLEQAIQIARIAAQDYPEHREFARLEAALREEWNRRQILAAVKKAEPLLESDPAGAAEVLRKTQKEFGPEPEVDRLLDAADRAVRERQEEREAREVLVRAREFSDARQWSKALKELNRGLASLPQRPELLQAAGVMEREIERERKEAEAREAARVEKERKEAEAREAARVEKERKEAEVREAARVERERKEAEAREAARVERERKEAEAREAARVERERKEAEAREAARLKRERKEAEVREAARVEKERKEAEAREAVRREEERKEAEAREAARVEKERKEAEAREAARVEKERKEAEAREAVRREEQRKRAESLEAAKKEKVRQEAAEREAALQELERQYPSNQTKIVATQQHPVDISRPQSFLAQPIVEPRQSTLPAKSVSTNGNNTELVSPLPRPNFWVSPKGKLVIGSAAATAAVLALSLLMHSKVPLTHETPRAIPSKVVVAYRTSDPAIPTPQVLVHGIDAPFQATSSARWLSVAPPNGQQLSTLSVHIVPTGLSPASYDGEIRLGPSDPNRLFTTLTIPVRLDVIRAVEKPNSATTTLKCQPVYLNFDYHDGDPLPGAKVVTVSGSTKSVQSSLENPRDSGWLLSSPTPAGVLVSVRPIGLSVGRHSGILVINSAGASAVRIPVTLNITASLGTGGGGTALEQVLWKGELAPGEGLTLQGGAASSGAISSGELPNAPIDIASGSLGNLAIEVRPSPSNGYKLQLRNKGSEPVRRFSMYFRVLK